MPLNAGEFFHSMITTLPQRVPLFFRGDVVVAAFFGYFFGLQHKSSSPAVRKPPSLTKLQKVNIAQPTLTQTTSDKPNSRNVFSLLQAKSSTEHEYRNLQEIHKSQIKVVKQTYNTETSTNQPPSFTAYFLHTQSPTTATNSSL